MNTLPVSFEGKWYRVDRIDWYMVVAVMAGLALVDVVKFAARRVRKRRAKGKR
jgi:hypothetical protein